MLKAIIRGGLVLLSGSAVSRVLFLLTTILIARMLGPNDFGVFSFLLLFVLYASSVLGSGVPTAVTKFMSAKSNAEDPGNSEIIGFLIIFGIISSLLFSLAIFFYIGDLGDQFPSVSLIIICCLLIFLSKFVRTVQDAIFTAFLMFGSVSRVRVLEGILFACGAALGVHYYGVLGGLLALFIAPAIAALVYCAFLPREVLREFARPQFSGMSRTARKFAVFAIPSGAAVFAPALAVMLAISWMARGPGGESEVALYNAGYQWLGPLAYAPMALAAAGFPTLVKAWAEDDGGLFFTTFFKVQLLAIGLACAAALLVWISSPWLSKLYGEQYVGLTAIFLLIAATAPGRVGMDVAISGIQATGRTLLLLPMTLLWAGVYGGVLIFSDSQTISAFSLLLGTAIAYAIGGVFGSLLVAASSFKRGGGDARLP